MMERGPILPLMNPIVLRIPLMSLAILCHTLLQLRAQDTRLPELANAQRAGAILKEHVSIHVNVSVTFSFSLTFTFSAVYGSGTTVNENVSGNENVNELSNRVDVQTAARAGLPEAVRQASIDAAVASEEQQLLSGMYGPLIVLEPGVRYDPQTDGSWVLRATDPGGVLQLVGLVRVRALGR